jgi:hypothetical protein
MNHSIPPWWMLSILGAAGSAALWTTVLIVTLRRLTLRPFAARLVLTALIIETIPWLYSLARVIDPAIVAPLQLGTQLPYLANALLEVGIWSLLAWAVLMRPQDIDHGKAIEEILA